MNGDAKTTAKRALARVDSVHESAWFERAARAGFAVNGLLHVLIGVLEHLLAREWKRGLIMVAKAAAYGALAVPAVTIGLGGRVDTDSDVREVSAFLVQSPLGIAALIAAGAGVVAVGGFFIAKGVRRSFLDDIRTPRGDLGTAVIVLGTVGYNAKGMALIAVGVLLVITAITVDPSEAGGFDEAFRSVVELPFGAIMLVLVALGLIVYGLYCFVRARRSNI